ncbi:hypothetical protein A2U01_0077249, partial [Trifolium medium]|nr:hypothetical protein [Trifolium medium]
MALMAIKGLSPALRAIYTPLQQWSQVHNPPPLHWGRNGATSDAVTLLI